MLGRRELTRLRGQKEALILASSLNRLTFRAHCLALSQAVAPLSGLSRLMPKPSLLPLILAPLAGVMLARSLRRSDPWFGRLASAAKWVLPLYEAWKRLRT